MLSLTRERMVRSGLVFALLTGVPVATFGTGYRASEAVLDGASAFLQREHRLVRVNLETGDIDAEAALELATGDQRLEVVPVRAGVVYVVNKATGEVWRMPTDTLQPQRVDEVLDQDGAAGEVAGDGGRAYLLDPERGQLTLLEDQGSARMSEVPLPAGGQVDQVVVDRAGTAWALSGDRGELHLIVGSSVQRTHTVPHPGQPAELTLADGLPVVYQPTVGVAAIYHEQGELRRVDGLPPAEESRVRVAAPGADQRVLVVAVRGVGELFTVDFETGQASPRAHLLGRESKDLGAPVVANGLVYLPDYTSRQVLVVDLRSLREIRVVLVRGRGEFEVVAQDGRVRVNNPYGALLTFDRGGHPRELDITPERDRDPEPKPDDQPDRDPEPGDPPEPEPEPVPEGPPVEVLVEVPDVVGKDRVPACDDLAAYRLDCRQVPRVEPGCPTGQVLTMNPGAGSAVPTGTRVEIVFCTPPTTVVPPPGATLEETCAAVQAAALTCQQQVAGHASSTAEFHRVVTYQPGAGTELEVGSAVAVGYLERPPAVTVPSVIGMDPGRACQTLQAAFVQCAPVPDWPSEQLNVVHHQPSAGTTVVPGTPVQYFYEDTPGVLLHRWKENAPGDANYLTIGGELPTGHNQQPDVGSVYPVGAAVPGLMVINGFTDQAGRWYYSATATPPQDNDPRGPVFACFNTGAPAPPGTVPLVAMAHPDRWVWKFAPKFERNGQLSGEYLQLVDSGWTRDEHDVCHIWPR